MATNLAKTWTPKTVEGIKPPTDKDRDYIPCPMAQGLVLMATAKGGKSWLWRSYHPDTKKPIKKTLGAWPAMGLADARDRAEAFNAARARGKMLDEVEAAAKAERAAEVAEQRADASQTLSWAWDTLYVPKFSPDAETVRLFEKHVRPVIGARPVASIVKVNLRSIINSLAATAPKSADRLTTNLKTLFKRLVVHWGDDIKMETSPAEYIVKPDGSITRRMRFLADWEIVYLLRAFDGLKGNNRVHADCLELLLHVGGRYDEGRQLPWSEIDFTEGVWFLPVERSKNGKEHRMKLPPILLHKLRDRQAKSNSAWVFPSTSNRVGDQAFNSSSKPMRELLAHMRAIAARDGREIERFSAHDLRRTFNSHMKRAARMRLHPLLSKDAVERAIHHVEGGMADWYDPDTMFEEKAAVYQVWSDMLDGWRVEAAKANARVAKAAKLPV